MVSKEKNFILKDNEPVDNKKNEFPEVTFSTFLFSLNASALSSLGLIDDPVAGKINKDIQLGKQTINILAMLKEKTKGNLTPEEEAMLDDCLYQLRIAYIKQAG